MLGISCRVGDNVAHFHSLQWQERLRQGELGDSSVEERDKARQDLFWMSVKVTEAVSAVNTPLPELIDQLSVGSAQLEKALSGSEEEVSVASIREGLRSSQKALTAVNTWQDMCAKKKASVTVAVDKYISAFYQTLGTAAQSRSTQEIKTALPPLLLQMPGLVAKRSQLEEHAQVCVIFIFR